MSTMEKCVFCGGQSQSLKSGGTILTKDGLSAHQYCLYFASGLAQRGDEDKGEGLSGFLPSDIRAEVRRSSCLKCIVCGGKGASIGCSVRRCRCNGHYACLQANKYIFQHFGNFEAFCPSHSPKQRPVPSQQSDCPICLSLVNPEPGFSQIYCPYCRTYFHRHCVERQALSAGRYYLRCPVCNSKDSYMNEMLKMGIDVPEKDAEWERSGQFVEDVEATKYCHAENCCCDLGRSHHSGIGKYKMRKCESCGQWMGHVLCLKGRPQQCVDCVTVPLRRLTAPLPKLTAPLQHPAAPLRQSAAPLQQPVAPLQHPVAPLQQSAAPLQHPAAPLRQSAAPLQQPVAPLRQSAASLKQPLITSSPNDLTSVDVASPTPPRDSSSFSLSSSLCSLSRKSSSCSLRRNSSLSLTNGTLKRKRVSPSSESCSCCVCVARYSKCESDSESSSWSGVTSESRHVGPLPLSQKSLIVSISLKRLHRQRKGHLDTVTTKLRQTSIRSYGQSVESRHSPHPAMKALARRHPGLKHLVSVSLPHFSPQQLLLHYKLEKMRKSINSYDSRNTLSDSALLQLRMFWENLLSSN